MTPRHRPTIVVTRDEAPDGPLASALTAGGADVLIFPTIAFESAEDLLALDDALSDREGYDWIAFTSGYAVDAVCERPAWQNRATGPQMAPGSDASNPIQRLCRIVAVGPVTATRLAERGVAVDLLPDGAETADSGSAAALARAIIARHRATCADAGALHRTGQGVDAPGATGTDASEGASLKGIRILWPRSDIAGPTLSDLLASAGAEIVAPVAYRNVPASASGMTVADLRTRLEDGGIDAFTFMSPSSARGLAATLDVPGLPGLEALAGRTLVASIGPTTTETLRELGAPPDVESPARSAGALARALLDRIVTRQEARP